MVVFGRCCMLASTLFHMISIDEFESAGISENNERLVSELSQFRTFRELRASSTYKQNRETIRALLDQPRVITSSLSTPRIHSFLRVVEWNIERGTRLAAII